MCGKRSHMSSIWLPARIMDQCKSGIVLICSHQVGLDDQRILRASEPTESALHEHECDPFRSLLRIPP